MHPFAPRLSVAVPALVCGSFLAVAPGASAQSTVTDPYRIIAPRVPSAHLGYTSNPYAGYLHGGADVIRSQGEFMVMEQEARLRREQVREAKLVNRKKEVEHFQWELEFRTEATEKYRQLIRNIQVERSLNDPPQTEIWEAKSLNDLLGYLQKRPTELASGTSWPIEPECLKYIHITSGKGSGNIGLLKSDQLRWPLLLNDAAFSSEREPIDRMTSEVREQARRESGLDKPLLVALERRVTALQDKLTRLAPTVTDPNPYVKAKVFLRDLDHALVALEEPDAAFYLLPPQGKTVAELVDYMTKKGVRFAPATDGCQRHYTALHRALANEVSRIRPASR
jgi:hypothetical protein